MIRIRVELISARTGETTLLGQAIIANDGKGTPTQGDYSFKLSQRGGRQWWREGAVEGFPRKRLGAWDLLYRCLREAVGDRNK